MKVLTRNVIRANAALNSELCAWDGDPIKVRHPRHFGPVFSQREHVQTVTQRMIR
jgi:hypothetical protein